MERPGLLVDAQAAAAGVGAAAECARLAALDDCAVLDTPPEAPFDAMARLAARLCETPIALVSLVDDHRQWFKAVVGLDVRETPREIAFCVHAIEGDALFEVTDAARDVRFADNPLVTAAPHIRSYAAVPLTLASGHRLGTLAVIDRQPRRLTESQREDLTALAQQVVLLLEERRRRHRAEAERAEAREQVEGMLDIAGRVARLGAWELDLATEGVVWSDVVAEIHAMPLGHSTDLTTALDYYLPADRAVLVHSLSLCREQGVPFDHELVLQPADGSRRWVRAIGEAVRDAQGRITRLRGACQDITERKRQTLQIEAMAARLSATLEAIPDPFVTVGADWSVQVFNRAFAQRVGVPAAALAGRALEPLMLGAGFRPPLMQQARAAMAGRQAAECEVEQGGAAPRRFELRMFPVEDGMALHAHDITVRSEAQAQQALLEARLRQAQKMESIGTLAGGVAHEFNNMLGAVLGHLAIAREALPAGSAALPPLATIEASAQRARTLVQQLLAFGRRQAWPRQRQRQRLQPLIDEALRLVEPALPARVVLKAAPRDDNLWVEADAGQIQQVVVNLCTNACQALAGRETGCIEVGLAAVCEGDDPAPTSAHLWVRDDGCGIPLELLPRVFEPFFTTRPVGQGTGLGLAVAHGIVTSHGGSIQAESRPGLCSSFHVQLPLSAEPGDVRAPAPSRGGRLDGLRVLCVDDDPVMLVTMQALLERAACAVRTHADGASALKAVRDAVLQHEAVDLLVTDFNMPGMDGLALIRETRRLKPGLPVVLASGYLDHTLHERARALGVQAVVPKERVVEDLVDAVRRAAPAPD